jgi:hypothetical protein
MRAGLTVWSVERVFRASFFVRFGPTVLRPAGRPPRPEQLGHPALDALD